MGTGRNQNERCETCRFWEIETTECHRHAPVMVTALGRSSSLSRSTAAGLGESPAQGAERAWPRTQSDEWCGEWDSQTGKPPSGESALPIGQAIATQTFLGRIAPSLETPDPVTLLEALLNQLSPDIRRVIVRVNGLDGQPLNGLKEVAREFRMSREQVRALVAAGEKRLAEVVGQLAARRHEKRDV
jgi:hypothetical protein